MDAAPLYALIKRKEIKRVLYGTLLYGTVLYHVRDN